MGALELRVGTLRHEILRIGGPTGTKDIGTARAMDIACLIICSLAHLYRQMAIEFDCGGCRAEIVFATSGLDKNRTFV